MSAFTPNPAFHVPVPAIPGEVRVLDEPVIINAGRETRTLVVSNTGDRPVQVGSHFHFADTNRALAFDRDAASGFRLDVAAGTAVRFEPGVTREVTLVALAGARVVPGLQLRGRSGDADSAGAGADPASTTATNGDDRG